mgnify:CR=1 FL=1
MENIKNFLKKKSMDFPIAVFKRKSIDFFFPIAFILAIVPLIVHVVVIRIDSTAYDIYNGALQTDLFSQKKASFLIFFCIILIAISIVFFKKIFEKKDKLVNSILIACSIFLLFTLLSSIFSQYKQASFLGVFDRAEGFITISCYMIIFIYSIYTFKTTSDYKYVIIPILILVAINSFLGFFQYIGKDLINSKLGLFLALGRTTSKLSLMYETGKLYGTFYHYNYVGSFTAIVLPILVSLTIFENKLINKIILGVGSLLSLWLLFGSTSRAGIIGVFAATILSIIIFGRLLLKKWIPLLISLISIIIVITGFNFATNGVIFKRIPALINDTFSIFNDTSNFDYREHTPVKDIKHLDGNAEVIFPNETLKISYTNNTYVFKNSKDEIIPYIEDNKIYTTSNEVFKSISFEYKKVKSDTKIGYIYLKIDGTIRFVFRLGIDNSVHLVNPNSEKDIEIDYPQTFGFKGKEKLGSMRGYIWSRSIPLLKNNIIIGSGPDTFIYQFPQNDLIGKYYAFDTPNMIIDKPHNLYLQIALNDGLIALLAFLVLMLIYIVDSIRLYSLKNEYTKSQILGGANCLGVVGYLFAGIFNDSVVSVAPVFWIVLGVGVALNYMNRKSLK